MKYFGWRIRSSSDGNYPSFSTLATNGQRCSKRSPRWRYSKERGAAGDSQGESSMKPYRLGGEDSAVGGGRRRGGFIGVEEGLFPKWG